MIRIISTVHPSTVIGRYTFSQLTTYTRRGCHRPKLSLQVGDKVVDFRLNGKDYYKDFDITHLQFEHDVGTKFHHLQCAQQNNTFSMVFRTPNNSKKGINLALQKLLQCGSRKYAVRDLPAHISYRSFSKLTPIQTTDQYLMFSFNTPIIKDFTNLFNVYASMIFDPLLRKEDFQEVVRRFTYQNQRLGFTGELAAELFEGQFQIDQTIYSLIGEELLGIEKHAFCKSLDLAQLSFDDLQEHYNKTVNLSNCTLVLHGDMNPQFVAQQFANNIKEFKPQTTTISLHNASAENKQLPKTINFEHLRQETILMLSFRIDNASEEECTLLEILSYILFDMPDSPFMCFNTPQTPYPPLYGFKQRYFNIGRTFNEDTSTEIVGSVPWFKQRQKKLIEKEAEIFQLIKQVGKKLNDKMIERCLMHLQSNYYQPKGINIIESILERLLQGKKLSSAFQVTALVSKLLRTYRKEEIFQKLFRKFLIENNNYIVLRGSNNPHIIEYQQNHNRSLLFHMQKAITYDKIKELTQYVPPSYLQDIGSLPSISPNQLECFEELPGQEVRIGKIRTVYNNRINGNKFTFKFDLTDLGDEDIPILPIFCKAFPQMGSKTMKKQSYQYILDTYVGKIQMNHETSRQTDGGLKVYAYLTIEFIDRNHQFVFSLLNGLFTDFDQNNLPALSKAIRDSATNCFHDVSQNLLHYHGIHLAASRSPYAFFQSPIYQARTVCAIAADIKKVTNPKSYLYSLSRKLGEIWGKMMGWSRVQLLWECRKQKKNFYQRHLKILLQQIHNQGIKPESIDISTFPVQKWQKYFPNYDQQMAFEAFTVPYRNKDSPAALVLSSLVNHSISTFNTLGGCFLYKGALVSFIQGGRQKYLQLQDHYKRIDELDIAKRKIFQSFNRYSVLHQFKSGITFEQARFFKEAVISVQKSQVENILNEYLLSQIKKGSSSILALGGKLQNYEPLLKKGWEIQRSIDDLSLKMESLSRQELNFKSERYIDIC